MASTTHLVVEVYRGDVEGALKEFKKRALKIGLLREMKRHNYYERPSVKRRRKQKEARQKVRKRERQMAEVTEQQELRAAGRRA